MAIRYPRAIQPLVEAALFKGKLIVIYGPRQVGKTTLVKEILSRYPDDSLYLNCDEPDVRAALTEQTSTALRAMVGSHRLVVIDEAQRVRNIGLTLKLLVDNYPDIQVVATGSSSFELSNLIVEPLTGRKVEFRLFPLSVGELWAEEGPLESRRLLERRLRYGMYPEVITNDDPASIILEIANSYTRHGHKVRFLTSVILSGFAPDFSRRRASSEESGVATRPFAGFSPQRTSRDSPAQGDKATSAGLEETQFMPVGSISIPGRA